MPNKYSHFRSIPFHVLARAHTHTYPNKQQTHIFTSTQSHTESSFNSFVCLLGCLLSRPLHTEQCELDNGNMYSLSLWFLILLPFSCLLLIFAVFIYFCTASSLLLLFLMRIVWPQSETLLAHIHKQYACEKSTLAIKHINIRDCVQIPAATFL